MMLAIRALPELLRRERVLRERAELRQAALVALTSELRELPALEDSARVLRDALLSLAPRLVAGRSEADASTTLTTHLRSRAERVSAGVLRVTSWPDSTRLGKLQRLSARLAFESDAQGLDDLLREWLTADPVIEIAELRLTAIDPSSPDGGPERLRIDVVAHAWAAIAGPDSTEKAP
jgi:hypothetical protein